MPSYHAIVLYEYSSDKLIVILYIKTFLNSGGTADLSSHRGGLTTAAG
jgi:hypothetical protein